MSRSLLLLFLVFWLAACSTSASDPIASLPGPTLTAIPSPAVAATVILTPSPIPTSVPPTATATAVATETPSATPTSLPPTATDVLTPSPPVARQTVTETSTLQPDDLWLGASDFRIHPDGDAFFSGDLISFRVYAHHGHDWSSSSVPDVDLEIWLGAPGQGELIAADRVPFYGSQDGQSWLEWVWDTAGVVGQQTLSVILDPDDNIQIGDENPDNNFITRTIELRPRDELPAVWADAHWDQQTSACCVFHYISGTAVERDIEVLEALADQAIAYAGEQLGEETDQVKLDVYLINRVLGHGGFAGGALILSYLDRFYAGGEWPQVFRHEGVHVLDQRFAEVRPALLTEGLAVYVAGGHFREQPIPERMAALLALDLYIPLAELADDFYPLQHEIGYLEAASFVDYLVGRFGWDRFKAFYGDMQNNDAGQAAMIDAALQDHFGMTLSQTEIEWLAALRALPAPTTQMNDLRLTIDFYETLRRYQRDWDPSAFFLEAWLPSLEDAERRGITADWLRHPAGPVNVTLETLFIAADEAIDAAAYARSETLLEVVNDVLDAGGDLRSHPLAAQYGELVQATAAAGYQAQRIELDVESNTACVLAAKEYEAETIELDFVRSVGAWRVTSWGN